MFIGEVSKRAGLSVKAIRLYEEKGLIITPKRQGVYRVYTEDHVEVLHLIAQAKSLGVTLAELKDVIKYSNGTANWPEINVFLKAVRSRLETEREDITERIARIDKCMNAIGSCPKMS